ncbi:MAG: hypothetical protein ACRD0L_14910, partial [Acidimicrobiales bacterium]
ALARRVARLEASLAVALEPPPAAELAPDPDVDMGLAAWVEWLVHTHELAERIPACWAHHPGLIAELRALRWLHDTALASSNPAEHIGYYDALARVLQRLGDSAAGRCARRMGHEEPARWPEALTGRGRM